MKKIMMIACGLLMASVSVNAQGLTFGAKAGVNYANVSNVEDSKATIGFHVGGIANYAFNESWSIQPEVLFSTKGYSFEVLDETSNVTFSYIEIPVSVKYTLSNSLNFSAGPYVGILMSAKAEDLDLKEFTNSTDIGFGAGVGYSLDNGLGFGLRYSMGLTGIAKEEVDGEETSNHSVIGLSVSYMFGGK
jgi:hypothetical protein